MAEDNVDALQRSMDNALAAVRDQRAEEEERRVLVLTAIITFLAALGVSGGTNLIMMLTKDPLIKQYKPTLSFISAWIGDGIIAPAVNVLIMMAFRDWGIKIGRRVGLVALLAGFGLMGVFQIVQATQSMINYTMPKPWKWTWLGYYHMLFMGSQFSFMFYYVIELYQRWRAGNVTDQQKKQFAAILALMALFALLLQYDYS